MSGFSPLRVWWTRRPPAAGAAVMATGILSVGLELAGHAFLSRVFLVLACVAWLALAVTFVTGLLRERTRWTAEARTPDALTAVAATAVLGIRFSHFGAQGVAEALLALAAVLWPVLLLLAVPRWGRRMHGGVFLACVATQALAALAATIGGAVATAWLAHAALVLFWLGLVLYGLALTRFDPRQLTEGAGDQWIAGGAPSVSALTGAALLTADTPRLYLWNEDDQDVLRKVTVVLLVLDLTCYVVLLAGELLRPRARRDVRNWDVRRWATAFPMGMTAAATLSVAAAVGVPWLRGPGQALVWIAVAVWVAVAAGALLTARAAIGSAR
ncbi:hypothetical protein AB0F77_09430 [Streptomyces sp. NPDC026672]|uniref:SLAC1 family transporter n=1 Tax=unclassified Streptomyces TaxID=2593676 RepID=UPI0033C6F2B0